MLGMNRFIVFWNIFISFMSKYISKEKVGISECLCLYLYKS